MAADIGYARVSTLDQNPQLQLDALAGCDRVFTDHASGKNTDRPELTKALDHVREGDTLVVWKLDRLGRSLPDLINVVSGLGERGVQFKSLTEGIDTTTASGRLLFHIMGSLAEFERDLIRERTRAGLAAAAKVGRRGGRPSTVTPLQRRIIREQWGTTSVGEIVGATGLSRATVYRVRAELMAEDDRQRDATVGS
jgi:DNA invertase Pin-like site-specific DNA recombinase